MTLLDKIGFEIEGEWGDEVRDEMAAKWRLEFHGDGSVRTCGRDERIGIDSSKHNYLSPWEANSVPYHANKVAVIKELFDELQVKWDQGEFHTNKSAGFHIHTSYVGFPSEIMSARFTAYFLDQLKKKFPEVYEMRRLNRFCRIPREVEGRISTILKKKRQYSAGDNSSDYFCGVTEDRYMAVNIKPAWKRHKTIELRVFPSDEPRKMYEYLLFSVKTINKFIEEDTFSLEFRGVVDMIGAPISIELHNQVNIKPRGEQLMSEVVGKPDEDVISFVGARVNVPEQFCRECHMRGRRQAECRCDDEPRCSCCDGNNDSCDCYSCECCEHFCRYHDGCDCEECEECERCTFHDECRSDCRCENCVAA